MDSRGAVSTLAFDVLTVRVGILGAGSIGCYIGACLIRSGVDVVLVGRRRLRDEIAAHGMHISDTDGMSFALDAAVVHVATDADALIDCDLVLVTVKSADTEAAAQALVRLATLGHAAVHAGQAPHLQRVVVSFQNGIGNADVLRRGLPGVTVIAGMVPWNVVWKPGAHFHRGTSGELMIEAECTAAQSVAAVLNAAGLKTLPHADLPAVMWGKLLLNLNNPINALSGLPLRQQLSMRGYRRILAVLMREGLKVMRAAGVRPAKAARLPPWLVPWVLDLPDALFLRVASSMLKIDPEARSSMWEDLQRGRATEIDYLNGAVVRLAAGAGVAAPFNQAMVALVHKREQLPNAPGMSPETLLAALLRRIN